MLKEQFEELKHTGQLPTPSGVGMKILILTQEEDCAMDEVVHVIQADPALTGRVVKLATSVQLSGGGSVSTVKEAAMRLGMRTVSNVALGFSLVAGNRSGRCEGFDYDRYWSWSLANAVAAQVISRELKLGDPAEVFTCGLLVRIGELALASVHPSEYAAVLKHLQANPHADLAQVEAEYFRINHLEVAEAMLEDWGLPPHFAQVAAILGSDGLPPGSNDDIVEEYVRILTASAAIAEVCLSDVQQQPHHLPRLKETCASLGVSAAEFCRIYDQIVPEWEDWCKLLKIPTGTVQGFEELVSNSPQAKRGNGSKAAFGTGLRILAVDDDPVSLRLLTKHLRNAGHHVVTASNGKEALAVALEANPQVVVTDWMMPEMDGIELCKTLRRYVSGRSLYILILTGRGDEDRVVEAFDAGADDYIVKPFKPKLLLARIRGGQRVVRLQEQVERDKKLQTEQLAKLAVLTRKLRAAAMTDALTELPNRRYAMKRMEMEWSNSTRSSAPFSVIMLDIDHFKQVNDTYGHDVGDLVLQETAKVIQATLRRGDVCARMGGEEFLVICPNTTTEGAIQVAERIRESIEANHIEDRGYSDHVTMSLGVATRSAGVPSIDALLKVADEAVYEAKEGGRNRVVAKTEPPPERESA